MDTSSYDNGQFWLFNDANPHLILAGAIGLVVVDICYLFVTLRMLLWRDKLFGSAFQSQPDNVDVSFSWMRSEGPLYQRLRHLWDDLTAFEGRNRKKWNAFLKLFDLAMETAMLRQLLQSGSPASLTYGFAGFLSLNALSCVVNVITDRFSALTEIFIDSVFDLCAAVLFPIVTLVYCYYNFDLDREVYLTYLEKLPPGSFEHLARSFADQSEIALFRVNFDSLRIDSLLDFALRINIDTEPKTYQEWLNPVDAYDKVKTLAGAGLLTSLQVINRQLLTWPDELRKCRDLKVIQMIYTSTQHIPSWTKELKCLETIQVEGKYGNPNLLGLPDNVFSDLPQLSMIHLGLHENIDRIPPLSVGRQLLIST
ncbi:hypothetical protein PC115_g9000 [Phytophthora cactorum]|uniref:Uncharacterized protein n=1 Tax=Phytophthora cactorum TaxID=29920 RepID=A0A8T1CMV6_9STRA|nr:hypothetical protein PC115_g9000 [Phytophthora cactorum]